MRRDMELIRAILRGVEEQEEPGKFYSIEGYDQQTVARHVVLLQDAGLVEASFIGDTANPIVARIFRLTWSGHDFLDAVRNDTVWRKTMAFVAEKGGGVTLEVVKSVAIAFLRAHVGLPPG